MNNKSRNKKYFYIPKQLMDDKQFKGISFDAKMLYSFMLNQLDLAVENNWFDESNQAYIYYTIQNIIDNFHCTTEKATKLLTELEKVEFIEKQEQGKGKPIKIFLKIFTKYFIQK